jgi:hypothetical protein
MKFSFFLENRESILESMTIRIKHHTTSKERLKAKKNRMKSSYKMKQKILARLRRRKKCSAGKVVDYDGKGCHKPKTNIGMKKRVY